MGKVRWRDAKAPSLVAAGLVAWLAACQTATHQPEASLEATSEPPALDEEHSSAAASALTAELATAAAAPEPEAGGVYTLGPISDDELKDAAYQALAQSVSAPRDAGDGTELGEISGFKFSIVKLLRGRDDISGEGGAASGMDVEVTGWYKRPSKEAEVAAPTCASFDALVPLVRQGDTWHLKTGEAATFGREDSEDCF